MILRMNNKTGLNPEMKNPVQAAFIFDVDGVITNPREKRVTKVELLERLATELELNTPVILNTGRSNEWMIERVILPLKDKLNDKTALSNFFAVGEKGLTWVSFDEDANIKQGVFNRNGALVEGFDLSVFLDNQTVEHFQTLERETKQLIDSKYSHSTFFDATKKAMISTEMHDGYDQPKYALEQIQFTADLHELLKREGLEGKFKVDPTTIATDIQIPEAGKHLGAKHILDWLKSANINPKHFITFGDSASDLEMADYLNEQNLSVDFIFVGGKENLSITRPYRIHYTTKSFDEGTLEYLSGLAS